MTVGGRRLRENRGSAGHNRTSVVHLQTYQIAAREREERAASPGSTGLPGKKESAQSSSDPISWLQLCGPKEFSISMLISEDAAVYISRCIW